MSSKKYNDDSHKNLSSNDLNQNSMDLIQSYNDEEKNPDNNELLKPIPINPKLLNNQNCELTTLGNSTNTMANITQESNIPIIYPQIQFHGRQQLNIYNDEKTQNFQQKQFQSKEINENNNLLVKKDKPCCNCSKTKCIKKYCECFSNSRYCNNCLCQDCMNKNSNLNNSSNSYNDTKYISDNEAIMCTCAKSGCNKKYCECYKAGKKCHGKCKCLNCKNISNIFNITKKSNNNSNKNRNYKNHEEKANNNIDNNILNEAKNFSRKSSLNESSIFDFKIQRINKIRYFKKFVMIDFKSKL